MKHVITDGGRGEAGINEKKDCTVRAVAIACAYDYSHAHQLLASMGRKDRDGFRFARSAEQLGFQTREDLSCMTLERALAGMQQGRFIVRHAHHVFAVINGVSYDTSEPSPKARVKMVYQFSEKSAV